ncbi:thiamine diphosphokinase [Paenisporosarcina antarctica]|uniref:Thiamine diphosphokinase n=1 Tax=Paenisporosarcina antarctica TaxID=417367 RepID=A0A4P6ZYD7_9BACL|nr:thiamine diphosphokinase [Paenisporosarcina antarctica]QBP41501.1 thiamine diphosphokinase [Paenisporosarcina antarctica]
MKTVVICAGGPIDELAPLEPYKLSDEVVFIGADKGSVYLLNEGIIPTVAVGDFDSLSSEEFLDLTNRVASVKVASVDKNETDTDLALIHSLDFDPQQVVLVGVTGGRLDHFISVLNSVYRFQKDNPGIQFIVRNKWNEMRLLTPGIIKLTTNPQLPFMSFFAFHENVEEITLTGMKYNVSNETINIGSSRFTSNQLLDEHGSISFSSGICLLIRSSDQ